MTLAELAESFQSSFVLFSPIRPIFPSPVFVPFVAFCKIYFPLRVLGHFPLFSPYV
jgi:hypothetical protein